MGYLSRVRRRTRTIQRVALVLPVVCVVVLALSWWSSRYVEPRPAARLYGTLSAHGLAVRAESYWVTPHALSAFEQDVLLELESPSGRVQQVASRRGGNTAEFNTAFGAERPRALRLWPADALEPKQRVPLAAALELGRLATPLSPVRRGGWVTGLHRGQLRVEVGVVRGVLAVPFPGEIVVRLWRGDEPVSGAKLELESTGAGLLRGGSAQRSVSLLTDAEGETRVAVVPREHVVELMVRVPADVSTHDAARSEAESDDPDQGSWFGALPVVPGALWVERIQAGLRVHSPIARSVVYVHLVRLSGESWLAAVPLNVDGPGASGELALPEAFADGSGFFAVASSEADTQSMALVGWPVGYSEPTPTFDLRLSPIADGVPAARQALSRGRARRANWALGSCALAALLEAVLLLMVMRRPAGAEPSLETERGSITSWIALMCITAAVLGLGLFGLFTP